MLSESAYMQRAIQLALLGSGYVAPNPMVGAVLVHEDRIIGEGWHEGYGQPHAEVNCLKSVREEDRALIPASTLYVTLEPCAHEGKTPPCTELIISQRIPHVVVGAEDPFPEVSGRGISQLRDAGVRVDVGIEKDACREMNRRFMTYQEEERPYIILKWAQTADGKMAGPGDDRLMITGDLSNRMVHKWRSEEAAILVGTNTALLDDPALTTRLWSGRHPVRAVLDLDLRLPAHLQLFNRRTPTVVFNTMRDEALENILFYPVSRSSGLINQIVQGFYRLRLQSVIVEGGSLLLQSFIDAGFWDEIRIITNTDMLAPGGLSAPELPEARKVDEMRLGSDVINWYRPL
jgi:diaminohydroxyphosphoribosylaminopyrimidine deaminase/5-amino-6-(5-phosphoribosylamino)uracil reductase